MPVAIADNGCTLCGSVTYGIREVDAFEELFYFLIESCASDDDLVELSSESIDHLFAYLLIDLKVDDGHLHE